MANEDMKLGYWLGKRDMLAAILAETHKAVRLPKQARFYKDTFKEEHFSHEWHVTPPDVSQDGRIYENPELLEPNNA